MVIFPYIQYASDMLEKRFGFGDTTASTLYSLPYIISGILSPLLGIIIDKIGKRALFSKCQLAAYNLTIFRFRILVMASSVLILCACVFTTIIPEAKNQNDS